MLTRHVHPQAARITLMPLLVAHLAPLRREPDDILGAAAVYALTLKERSPAKHGVFAAQMYQPLYIGEKGLLLAADIPMQPAQLVVLTVDVVVALLAAAEGIARRQHRHALGE